MPTTRVAITHVKAVVPVTAYFEGDFADWPSHMQDAILKALHDKSIEDKRTYFVYKAWCEPGVDGERPYVVVIGRHEAPAALIH